MFEQYFTIRISKMQEDGSIKPVDFKIMESGETYFFIANILNREEIDDSEWNSFFNREMPEISDNETFIYIYDFKNYMNRFHSEYEEKLSIAEKGKTLVQVTRKEEGGIVEEPKFNIEDTKENRIKLVKEYILNYGDGVKLEDLTKFKKGYTKKISGVSFIEISLISYEEYADKLTEEFVEKEMELNRLMFEYKGMASKIEYFKEETERLWKTALKYEFILEKFEKNPVHLEKPEAKASWDNDIYELSGLEKEEDGLEFRILEKRNTKEHYKCLLYIESIGKIDSRVFVNRNRIYNDLEDELKSREREYEVSKRIIEELSKAKKVYF